ncbi:MAG: 30S ribosomal protein S5 [Candidatus Undinarchaeales archaeon]
MTAKKKDKKSKEMKEKKKTDDSKSKNYESEEAKKLKEKYASWKPKTGVGKLVKAGKITSIDEIFTMGKKIQEPEIIDILLPDLEELILKIGSAGRPFKWVQRMTDSGRRNRYFVMVAVGNRKGYLGLGTGTAKEYGGAIEGALRNAKLNVINITMGCGSWDCGCGETHSVPVETKGKAGSVKIELKPAPKGTGLVVNKTSRGILELAGVKDIWSATKGHTATRPNLAKATFNALYNLNKVKGR